MVVVSGDIFVPRSVFCYKWFPYEGVWGTFFFFFSLSPECLIQCRSSPECLYNVVSAFSVKLVQLVLDLCVYMFVCMHAWFVCVCVCVCVPNTGHLNNVTNSPIKSRCTLHLMFHHLFHHLTVFVLFCNFEKNGLTMKICLLCFVVINSIHFNISCV